LPALPPGSGATPQVSEIWDVQAVAADRERVGLAGGSGHVRSGVVDGEQQDTVAEAQLHVEFGAGVHDGVADQFAQDEAGGGDELLSVPGAARGGQEVACLSGRRDLGVERQPLVAR
jgi:hypothetical protein